jgi:hypothetical protein
MTPCGLTQLTGTRLSRQLKQLSETLTMVTDTFGLKLLIMDALPDGFKSYTEFYKYIITNHKVDRQLIVFAHHNGTVITHYVYPVTELKAMVLDELMINLPTREDLDYLYYRVNDNPGSNKAHNILNKLKNLIL